ncbi:MAG: glycosyltransferase family 4 protein [Deltaproteobacteria bacterium]|nr:glycosyltransferase family 4 protein [Deltaproteobacteria bacterium]
MTFKQKQKLNFFIFAYWHDARFKVRAGGPIKVYELTQNLAKRHHQVYLFIPKIGYPEQQTIAHVCPIPFIDIPILRFVSFQLVAFFWAISIALRRNFPDIIYVRIMWSFLPMILGKLLSVPVILEINDSPHRAYASINNFCKRTIVHLIDKISFTLSDYFLPVTQKIAKDMNTLEGITFEKMAVLPSGANIDLFHPMDKLQCSRELGFKEPFLYIGFIGTFFHYQGIDTLIGAAPLIIQKCPNVRFLILGDGPMKDTWQRIIIENELESYFILPGFIPYNFVPSYCAIMDICVAPFQRSACDTSGVKIFDYLACGKPVLTTDVGETSSFFRESGAVIIVPPEDPAALANGLDNLLKDKTLREEMGKKGRAFVTGNYSRTQIAEIVETVSMKLLRSPE